MDSLAHYLIKPKWGADAVYLCLPPDTAGAKYSAGLRSTASGAKGGHNLRQRAAARGAKEITFLPTAYTPLWEQKIRCHLLQLNQLGKHIYHP